MKEGHTLIKLENVYKSFGDYEVLKGVSLDVPVGEVTVILGPSGSGKTTFLRCINFLEKANKGTLTLAGLTLDLHAASRKEILDIRRKTSMVFQAYNLFANMTAEENVAEGLITVKRISKEEAYAQAKSYLDMVGMSNRGAFYPVQLSGGQQQRVGIARALAMRPEVILFDEPTSALDPELVGEVLLVMKDIAKYSSVTMLVVTHEIGFARDVADQVVFMEGGVIVERGTAIEVIDNPQEERTQQFLNRYLSC